ncbi:MAG: RMD1 family protein [Polyangiales bacterium]
MDSSAPIPAISLEAQGALFHGERTIQVRALLLGGRIAPGIPEGFRKLADKPLVLAGRTRGCAVVFRYGAVVLFGMTPQDEQQLYAGLSVREPLPRPESELVELRIDGDFSEEPRIDDGALVVPADDLQYLELIGEALAKSVVLAYHENAIATVFDRIEPLAQNLHENHNTRKRERELLEYIGGALLSEQRMVGRVEVREKPDLLWDNAALERFYQRLEREYELRDRATAVQRKLDLISRTAQTALDLLEQRSTRRVEWYIVVLIVIEILLTLYSMLT